MTKYEQRNLDLLLKYNKDLLAYAESLEEMIEWESDRNTELFNKHMSDLDTISKLNNVIERLTIRLEEKELEDDKDWAKYS